MSANEGSGNPNGTSAYFNNGSSEGSGAGFFDHNQPAMNQWGFPPQDQNSAPGGFPQASQHHQQQYQPQQVPQFYNPAEFQKTGASQEPEIFTPFGGGNAYQPQQSFPQDGFQQQQQQSHDYSQFNQNNHGEGIPQQQHQQQQNPEADHGQVPYQQGWQGYSAPADHGYGHTTPVSQAEGQGGHWQNQDHHAGQQANDGYPADHYTHPGYGYGTDMSASTNSHQESGRSENPTQKFEPDDTSGNSGIGAFFHDDGSDFVISSDKGSAQASANASERTSPDASGHDPKSLSLTSEQGTLQESVNSESDQTNSNIEPFQPCPQNTSHISSLGHDHTSEGNMASAGDMQGRAAESSVSNQDSQSVTPVGSNSDSSHDLSSAVTDHSNYEGLQTEPSVVNHTPSESNVQLSVPNSDIKPVQHELSPAHSSVSDSSEMPVSSESAEVVHQLLTVPVSSLSPQSTQQDSESVVKPLPPPLSQEDSSSLRSDGGDLPDRVGGSEFIAVSGTNSVPPSAQDPNVSQTDAPTVFPTPPSVHQQHQQPQQPPPPQPQQPQTQQLQPQSQQLQQPQQPPQQPPLQQLPVNPAQPDLTSPSITPSLSTQSSLDACKSSELEDSGKKRSDSLSSGSHPSAFRQVRSHHGHRDISVNPSPPLWQAEVPALPGNILLAPALNISTNINPLVPASTLSAPSLSTPRQLADSVASVSVPPVPSVATSLLSGNNNPVPQPPVSNTSQPSATSAPTSVQQVTQSVSQLDINKTVPDTSTSVAPPMSNVQGAQVSQQQQLMPNPNPNPVACVQPVTLSQPNPVQPTTQQQNVVQQQTSQPQPATSVHGIQPTNSAAPTQGLGVASTPQQQPQHLSSNIPNQQQQTSINNPPPMQQQNVPGQQGVSAPQPQQPLQQDYQQQQQMPQQQPQLQQQPHPQQQQQPQGPQSQQPGYNQYPPGGGQWYPNPANRQPYPQGGYYQGGGYGQGYRGYGYGSPYARQGSYSRQDPYYQHGYVQRTPQRSGEGQAWDRPQSRQGSERPRSRQGWPDEQDYDPRYPRSRRDPRYYGGVDEYGRPYDRRYYEYYRRRQSAQYRDREYQKYYEQQRNRSGSQQHSQDASLNASDASLTEKKDNSQNESFSEEFHHQGGGTPEQYGTNQSAIYPSGYDNYDSRWRGDQGYYDSMNSSNRATYDGSQYYNQDYSWQQEEQQQTTYTPPPPERRTPVKHSLPHVIARFSPGGQLIKVLPNVPADGMPALVEVHNVEMMMEQCDEIQEYKAYPGPLIKGETHKNDVLHFAAAQATECRKSTDLSDKESAALLWDLLVLLCRQNGTVVETDISDLLLKDHPMTSREASASSQEGQEEAEASQEGADISDLLSELPKSNEAQDALKQTHRFRELLLFGRKKEALEWAMKKGLWGHALLLASKMDNRTHASVMTRFANSLPMNDPLQTLYQLMSDRQPAAVTSCNDEKWGDWRPHLAMVMSNLSSSAEVGYKSVVTLGDSLSSRGLLHASQFCYLMAQIGFGIYSKKTTKIVLLGSSHNLPFNKFSTNSAIQLTEIYEYAQMLANKHFLIPNFQAYKFIYACRLADFGFTSQALRYCETIANTIQCSANYYNSTLVSQVCQLSHRLKHHDPEFHDMREITEPQWIVPLENILTQINEGQLKPPSSSGTPMPWVESSSNLSTLGVESADGTVQAMGEGVSAYPYEGGYQPEQQYAGQGYEGQDNQQQVYQSQDQQADQQQVPFYDYNQQQQLQQDGTQQTSQQQQQQQQQQYYQYDNYQPYNNQPISNNFAPNQDPGASMGSNFSEYSTTTNPSETEGDSTEFEQSGASQFDFNNYNKMQQQNRSRTNTLSSMGGPPSPQKTLTPPDSPNSFTAPRNRARTTSGGSTASVASQKAQQKQEQKQPEPKEAKPKPKFTPKSSQGGWLRWFNKKLGGSNIHLPDDTKKTIEWDPVKKQWVNKSEDADEADSGPPPPPPSDKEISGSAPPSSTPSAMQPPGSTPGLGGGGLGSTAPPPPAGANKFSRKFGAGNYVDVLNKGKGTSSLAKTGDTSSLFQTFPTPGNTAPVNFFIPDSSASEDTQTSNQEGDPQVGNPGSQPDSPNHEQGGGQGSEDLSRSSSMSDLSNEVSQHMAHQPTAQPLPSWPQEGSNTSQQHQPQQQQQQQQPQQPAGVPMFYNPQQFASPAGASTGFGLGGGAGGQAKRGYGQPRQYPKQR